MKSPPLLSALLAVAVAVSAPSAHAALGGSPMVLSFTDEALTVRTERRMANARALDSGDAATAAGFSVRETTLSSGTVVREYLDSNGTVFGVAWQGPVKPNLVDLLGSYFHQFSAGVREYRAAHGVRAPVAINSDTLVVRMGGHMGSFSGQAWLPSALPSGVTGTAIQ
ncbi:DUF2844 domain-containing protein [Burkholderia territorii]|uniref:DUF2844 domain-containing protein n=1 Tax=Burkholderia territorii TaxID=1503055 RepID=UPI0009BE7B97|nr:DUF2844 domain-containing protein [Burkholderia territorii]